MADWLTVTRGTAPLLVSIPHTGIDLAGLENRLVSPWLGRRDCDWWIDNLYDFAGGPRRDGGAHGDLAHRHRRQPRPVRRLALSRARRRPALCPTETFDGDPLYREGEEPGPSEIDERRESIFRALSCGLAAEIDRLRGLHGKIVLYDCHSIRSVLPRLFEGTLPVFNLGTNDGKSADPALQAMVGQIMAETGESLRHQRPLQGRLDHAPLRQPQGGVPCAADGTLQPRLHARARRQGRAGQLAGALRCRVRRADPRHTDENPRNRD